MFSKIFSLKNNFSTTNFFAKKNLPKNNFCQKKFHQKKGGLSGVEVEPELIAKDIGNSGWI